MEKMSTVDAMHELVSETPSHLIKENKTIVVFFNLAEAFDTVTRELLLDVLTKYEVKRYVVYSKRKLKV